MLVQMHHAHRWRSEDDLSELSSLLLPCETWGLLVSFLSLAHSSFATFFIFDNVTLFLFHI